MVGYSRTSPGSTNHIAAARFLAGKSAIGEEEYFEDESSFRIFPNPAHDWLIVELGQKWMKGALSLVNINGKKLVEQIINESSVFLPVESYPAGIYFLTLSSKDNSKAIRQKVILH